MYVKKILSQHIVLRNKEGSDGVSLGLSERDADFGDSVKPRGVFEAILKQVFPCASISFGVLYMGIPRVVGITTGCILPKDDSDYDVYAVNAGIDEILANCF